MIFASKGRLLHLCRALERLVPRTGGLERVAGRPADGACTLRLTANGGVESVLEVSAYRVQVTTRAGRVRRPDGLLDEVVDRLEVDLSNGYGWNVASCESPDELAELLVRHMHRRVKDAGPHRRKALAG